jgi:hypothetical protein
LKGSNPNDGICDVPFCHKHVYLVYYGYEVCLSHWRQHCEEKTSTPNGEIPFSLKKIFGIEVEKTIALQELVVQESVKEEVTQPVTGLTVEAKL